MIDALEVSTARLQRAKAVGESRRSRAIRAGSFTGASRSKRSMRAWSTSSGDVNVDTLSDLPILRSRSRDLFSNNPIARGLIGTIVLNSVGSGLRFQARVDSEVLGISDEKALKWERTIEPRFRLWAKSKNSDKRRRQNFYRNQRLALLSMLVSGDCVALLPHVARRGSISPLCVHLIEADRLATPFGRLESDRLRGGVEMDAHGAPTAYHILKKHPGSDEIGKGGSFRVAAQGTRSGRDNVLHLLTHDRPGQVRGVPLLSPSIERIKQIDRFKSSTLVAAEVRSRFTVFIKRAAEMLGYDMQETDNGTMLVQDPQTGASLDLSVPEQEREEMELLNGGIHVLEDGEEIQTANPNINQEFAPMHDAMLGDTAMGQMMSYEVMTHKYQSSYSASKASRLDAGVLFRDFSNQLADDFCHPTYEAFLAEQVLSKEISAPGFFDDPVVRAAWSGSLWIPPAMDSVDPVKDLVASAMRVELGYSTKSQETAATTGRDYEENLRQRRKEATQERQLIGTAAGSDSQSDDKPAASAQGSAFVDDMIRMFMKNEMTRGVLNVEN